MKSRKRRQSSKLPRSKKSRAKKSRAKKSRGKLRKKIKRKFRADRGGGETKRTPAPRVVGGKTDGTIGMSDLAKETYFNQSLPILTNDLEIFKTLIKRNTKGIKGVGFEKFKKMAREDTKLMHDAFKFKMRFYFGQEFSSVASSIRFIMNKHASPYPPPPASPKTTYGHVLKSAFWYVRWTKRHIVDIIVLNTQVKRPKEKIQPAVVMASPKLSLLSRLWNLIKNIYTLHPEDTRDDKMYSVLRSEFLSAYELYMSEYGGGDAEIIEGLV